ncbi:MAG: N-acetylmuramoyl-L-alanine amidase [Clostridia bacterium]|nr:N-acetylmuramoyl-L-alanine amidase [Clostridia bacterium]
MIIIINKKRIFVTVVVCIIIFATIFFAFFNFRTEYVFSVPNSKYTVVVDAGHGGIDGGCVGSTTGVFESELNLAYAYNLAKQLQNMNISVVLTRTDSNGLYETGVSNLKRSDMKKRREIIENVSPDLIVSLHMNSYSLKSCQGAQAFYKKGNECGEMLATYVQTQMYNMLGNAKKTAQVGDYYLVTCTDIPSVLVECGFLSNVEEELLLQKKSYQDKVCYAILCGVVEFLNEKTILNEELL